MRPLLFICFFCSTYFLAANAMQFENNLKTAFEKAKLENKVVFIEYYNSECPVCIKANKLFESNDKLNSFYTKLFVNYRIDTHQMGLVDSMFLVKTHLSFRTIPYFLFFDANENFLHVSAINLDVDFFIEIGLAALKPKERSCALANKFNKGDRSIKTLYAYSQLVQLYENDSLTTVLADELYKSFPKDDLGNKKSYVITKHCVNDIENGFFEYWIKNIDKLEGLESEKHKGEGKKVLGEIVRKSIFSKKSKSWDQKKIEEVKKYILLTELSQNPDAFFKKNDSNLPSK